MESVFKTHIGKVRQSNQDHGVIVPLDEETTLVIVADGMGGHKAGEVASQMATELIQKLIMEQWNKLDWSELLLQAIYEANEKLYTLAQNERELEGMGTTIEVGLLSRDQGLIAHVGDSRVYLLHNDELEQITEDHSLVYALYKSGQISYQEIETHPQKNLILRAIGTEPKIDVDIIPFTWTNGDRILLCSDGLSKHMSHELITSFLKDNRSVDQVADRMIQYVLDAGGDDNITIILVENTLPLAGGEAS